VEDSKYCGGSQPSAWRNGPGTEIDFGEQAGVPDEERKGKIHPINSSIKVDRGHRTKVLSPREEFR